MIRKAERGGRRVARVESVGGRREGEKIGGGESRDRGGGGSECGQNKRVSKRRS